MIVLLASIGCTRSTQITPATGNFRYVADIMNLNQVVGRVIRALGYAPLVIPGMHSLRDVGLLTLDWRLLVG